MTKRWQYADAAAFWEQWRNHEIEDPAFEDELESAETFLLDHRPKDLTEVELLLTLLAENFGAGGRSDRRDIEAIVALRGFIRDAAGAMGQPHGAAG